MEKTNAVCRQEEPEAIRIMNEEFMISLKEMREEHVHLDSLRFFLGQAAKWYRQIRTGQISSRVVILGCGVPEELVMASGQMPFRILGGNHESCLWSDDLVPRDTDPVSRSVLGYVQCLVKREQNSDDTLYIISSGSDSSRKIAGQLITEGRNVFVTDIPPVKHDGRFFEKWKEQLIAMCRTVTEHVNGKITAGSLKNAVKETARARPALHEFSMLAPECDRVLSPSAATLIRNSYYYASDLHIWTLKLKKLMLQLREQAQCSALPENDRPGILVAGSPIYFPNDKIPSAGGSRVHSPAHPDQGISEWEKRKRTER